MGRALETRDSRRVIGVNVENVWKGPVLNKTFLCLFGVVVVNASAQQQVINPTFEVATITPAAQPAAPLPQIPPIVPLGAMPMAGRGRVQLKSRSLLELIAIAYRTRTAQVSGPGWMANERFDVLAKLPSGTNMGQANEMLQSLLTERFGLKLHRESKELSGYVLVVDKGGAKLTQSTSDPQLSSPATEDGGYPLLPDRFKTSPPVSRSHTELNNVTLTQLAAALSRHLDAPVVDATGLQGRYNITLEVSQDRPDTPGESISEALRRLGLKLERRKVRPDILIIDEISRTPAPN